MKLRYVGSGTKIDFVRKKNPEKCRVEVMTASVSIVQKLTQVMELQSWFLSAEPVVKALDGMALLKTPVIYPPPLSHYKEIPLQIYSDL